MLVLILIQTILQSDSVPERIFWKSLFRKKKPDEKLPSMQKVNVACSFVCCYILKAILQNNVDPLGNSLIRIQTVCLQFKNHLSCKQNNSADEIFRLFLVSEGVKMIWCYPVVF